MKDLVQVNKVIKRLRANKVKLKFPNLGNLRSTRQVSFSDASFGNLCGGSQGGIMVFLVGENGRYAPVIWQSKKIKRIVKSTIAAETLALVEGSENCFFLRHLMGDIVFGCLI